MTIDLTDIIGQRFNAWTVMEISEPGPDGRAHYLCSCVCGASRRVSRTNLKAGRSKGCGCTTKPFVVDNLIKASQSAATYFMGEAVSQYAEYNVYKDMMGRCHDKNHKSYPAYGGRGIAVCERWKGNPSAFLEDMHPRPRGLWLERLDNDKGYCPENCVWTSRKEQMRNTRSTKMSMPLARKARRLRVAGWTIPAITIELGNGCSKGTVQAVVEDRTWKE